MLGKRLLVKKEKTDPERRTKEEFAKLYGWYIPSLHDEILDSGD